MMIINYARSSYIEPIRQYVSSFLTPVQSGISSFGKVISETIDENLHLHEVYDENQTLRNEINTLIEENNRLKSDSQELKRLRELYDLDTEYMQYPKVGARVIARSSEKWFNEFKLDKGLADGIQTDMNVICDGGLLGIVTEVGSNYCMVRSIIDDDSNVYAESQYSGDTCLVQGNMTLYESGYLKITNIDQDAVFNDGDAVITSSLSTKFLPGILIGYASEISKDNNLLTKSGRLIPVASFENIKEVLILTTIKTSDGLVETGITGVSDAEIPGEIIASPDISEETSGLSLLAMESSASQSADTLSTPSQID